MPTRKPDTSSGFRPRLPAGKAIHASALAAIRTDGALESSLLSPQLHQALLGMARVRNAISSFRLEGERVKLGRARSLLESRQPESASERGILRLADAYRDVAEGRTSAFTFRSSGRRTRWRPAEGTFAGSRRGFRRRAPGPS